MLNVSLTCVIHSNINRRRNENKFYTPKIVFFQRDTKIHVLMIPLLRGKKLMNNEYIPFEYYNLL